MVTSEQELVVVEEMLTAVHVAVHGLNWNAARSKEIYQIHIAAMIKENVGDTTMSARRVKQYIIFAAQEEMTIAQEVYGHAYDVAVITQLKSTAIAAPDGNMGITERI